jgi:Ca2+-binding EF-hand superfamily protein
MKPLLLALAVAFSLGGAAAAQQLPNPDLNRDGKVTRAEFKKMQAQRSGHMFNRLDGNKDGKVTRAEMQAVAKRFAQNGTISAEKAGGAAALGARFFEVMDDNGNGVVTKAEMDAAAERRFKLADTNSDGVLSKAEMRTAEQQLERGDQ